MVFAALAGAGALVAWSCAPSTAPPPQTAASGERPSEPTPDGGWANYKPGPAYGPDPMRAAATQPSLSPASPVGRDLK